MNGWHRLWVLVTLIYGALAGIATIDSYKRSATTYPVANPFDVFDAPKADTSKANPFDPDAYLASKAQGTAPALPPGWTVEKEASPAAPTIQAPDPYAGIATPVGKEISMPSKITEEKKNKIGVDFARAAREEASARRLRSTLLYFLAIWLAPSFALLLIGHGIVWVKHGFKNKKP